MFETTSVKSKKLAQRLAKLIQTIFVEFTLVCSFVIGWLSAALALSAFIMLLIQSLTNVLDVVTEAPWRTEIPRSADQLLLIFFFSVLMVLLSIMLGDLASDIKPEE